MKAAILKEAGKLQIDNFDIPQPGLNEVLVRVKMAGICGSDNSLFHGKLPVPLPVIPGHEAVGHIESLGPEVTSLTVGQRVTIHPNYFCGDCPMCKKGLTNICRNKIRLGVDINGVFADYVVVPIAALYVLPDTLSTDAAVFVEPLAVAVHGINQAPPASSDRVLVFGAGVIGQLTLQLALLKSKDVTACDLVESRLQLARKMGATETIGDKCSIEQYESSFDIIFETSGAPAGMEQAIKLAAPGGTIVLLGIPGQSHPVSTVMIVRKELRIFGSMIYTTEFPESIRLLEQGLIKTEPLVSGRITLAELSENLVNFSAPERMKTLVTI